MFNLRSPSEKSLGELLFTFWSPSEQSVGELLFTLCSPSEQSVSELLFILRSPSENSVGELLFTLWSPSELSVGVFHYFPILNWNSFGESSQWFLKRSPQLSRSFFVIGRFASLVFSSS